MKSRLLLLATAAALTCLAPAIHTPVRADVRRPPSLTALVGRNALTRDTNGDGLPDSVAARVIVPSAAALGDIEAATNLAARLGYDTTALSLPIVVRDSEVEQPSAVAAPILVGRENRFIKQLIDTRAIDIAVLKPGQGLIAAVASPLGGGDGLVVVGGDDEGTVNAGVELAARLLEDLDLAHRRGQEPRTLNFANVATTAIEIVAGRRAAAHAAVSRTGLNQRTLTPPIDPDELAPDSPGDRGAPAQAAAAGPARAFDLSNAFSIDRWYGDAYADLIPDRTDAAIVLGTASDSLAAAHIAARLGLETTGITLPLTRVAERVRAPEREPSPILVGRSNALVQRLAKIGKVDVDGLQPGEGVLQIVPRAFGNATATVVAGSDTAGTDAAATYLARRVPFVWDNARGSIALSDVALQVDRFLRAKRARSHHRAPACERSVVDEPHPEARRAARQRQELQRHPEESERHSAPVENPDGAQMAFDLQKLTPNRMLHAGRYSALGMDVASQVGLTDPLLPESLVRTRVWREWLPDIYLNPQGYPSHEWVRPFAGYVPPGFRTYLSTRGWYTTVGTLRDPRYPNHADAVEALRESIVREINSNPDVRANGQYSVHRIEEDATRDAVSLTTIRVRPVLPGKTAPAAHATTSSTGGK